MACARPPCTLFACVRLEFGLGSSSLYLVHVRAFGVWLALVLLVPCSCACIWSLALFVCVRLAFAFPSRIAATLQLVEASGQTLSYSMIHETLGFHHWESISFQTLPVARQLPLHAAQGRLLLLEPQVLFCSARRLRGILFSDVGLTSHLRICSLLIVSSVLRHVWHVRAASTFSSP